jgi:endoglycosylceramidase
VSRSIFIFFRKKEEKNMFKIFLLLLISIINVQGISKIGLKQLSTNERIYIEVDTGRQIIFHGVNAIVKGFPYIPSTNEFDINISLTEKDHETLASLGVNVYRLGTMWKGVEPIRGNYNQTYLNELHKIINSASQYGIYSLLDMHQDVISEYVCGEGIPDWAIDLSSLKDNEKFPAPLSEPYINIANDGYPTRQDCNLNGWPSYYQTYANNHIFEELYNINGTILSSWGKFWGKIANEFQNDPSILGYELINEPWAGDVYKNPKLLLPGIADKERLQPAYDVLAENIRQYDNNTLIFFAAVTWDDIVSCGFDHAPG